MRFALIGCDEMTFRLARFLRDHPEHLITTAFAPTPDPRLVEICPHALTEESSESLLANSDVDAALSARASAFLLALGMAILVSLVTQNDARATSGD